ncbi:MAG: C45 family autoproteolytic acyltransferase/hydrolase [Promethearchaeota archaeon]
MITMHHVTLEGSYYEMGFTYGKELKIIGFKLPVFSDKAIKLGKECKQCVETIFPEFLDELHGIADAAELNRPELYAMTLRIPDFVLSAHSCTIFAVTDGDQTFMGRNYDMYYSFKNHIECYFTNPDGGYKSIGQTDIFVGREDGVNEKGLGVAMSGTIAYFEPGLTFWVGVRYLLDKCQTVQQGIDFLTDVPHYCTITYLLVDVTGDMAVVEVSPMRTAVRRPKDRYIISTNHLNHPKMQNIKLYEPKESRIRYNKILESLGKRTEKLDENFLKRLLSDHEGLVCSHIEKIKLGTLWSIVANINTRQIWRAEGHPCTNQYVEDNRLQL